MDHLHLNSASPRLEATRCSPVRTTAGVASFFRYCILEFAETALEIATAPGYRSLLFTMNGQAGVKVSHEGPRRSPSVPLPRMRAPGQWWPRSGPAEDSPEQFPGKPFAVQSQSSIYLDAREKLVGGSPPFRVTLPGGGQFKALAGEAGTGGLYREEAMKRFILWVAWFAVLALWTGAVFAGAGEVIEAIGAGSQLVSGIIVAKEAERPPGSQNIAQAG